MSCDCIISHHVQLIQGSRCVVSSSRVLRTRPRGPGPCSTCDTHWCGLHGRVSNQKHGHVASSLSSCSQDRKDCAAAWEEEEHITETLQTPLGLVLAENTREGCVYIESIEPGSHAEKSGVFKPGDILVACSAIAMKTCEVSIYNRNSRGKKGGCCSTGCPDCPFNVSNWQRIMFDCRSKSFDAVVAALSSNNARWIRRNTPATITLTVARSTCM